MKSRPALLAAATVVLGLLPWRGASAEDHVIVVKGLTFIPEDIQIPVGDSLTWINEDSDQHDPAAESGEFDSPTLAKGQRYSHRFDQAGNVGYFCKVHTYMRGTITVGEGPRPERPPAPERPATTAPSPNTTTTQGFPPAVVPYPGAITR
jgi:plastocyanin